MVQEFSVLLDTWTPHLERARFSVFHPGNKDDSVYFKGFPF